jgi:hypothetical protein
LHAGKVVAQGNPAQVVSAYQEFLDSTEAQQPALAVSPAQPSAPKGYARLTRVRVGGLAPGEGPLQLVSLKDDLHIDAHFSSDPNLPCPSLAVTVHVPDGRLVSSAGAWNDGHLLKRDAAGSGHVNICFQSLPLLKGRYYISLHLFCERGLHIYDVADRAMYLTVTQVGLEQGLFHMPRIWSSQIDDLLPLNSSPEAQNQNFMPPDVLLDWLSTTVPPLPEGASVTCPFPQTPGLETLAPRFGLAAQDDGSFLKTRSPRWSLAWVRSTDTSASWLDLFKVCFGHEMSQAHWDWKYSGHDLAGVGVFSSSTLVGFYGCLPRQVLNRGVACHALQIGDVMVHPSERGVLTRQGPFYLSCTTLLEQLMGFDRPYLLGFGFPNQKALKLATRQGLYESVDQIAETHWPVNRIGADWRIRSQPVFLSDETAVNACWADMAQAMTGSILGVRDWAFVTRRYMQHPSVQYTLLKVKSRFSGKALGIVVLRDRAEDGLELIDLIGKPSNFPQLIRSALRQAYLLGRQRVFAWCTLSHQHLLQGWNGVTTPIDVWIPANVWSEGPTIESLKNQWWLMGGDTDFR